MKYAIEASTSALDKYDKLPQRYLAYIPADKSDEWLLEQLKYAAGGDWNNTRRVFDPQERNEAKAWLASD